jgi:hypothetical protein
VPKSLKHARGCLSSHQARLKATGCDERTRKQHCRNQRKLPAAIHTYVTNCEFHPAHGRPRKSSRQRSRATRPNMLSMNPLFRNRWMDQSRAQLVTGKWLPTTICSQPMLDTQNATSRPRMNRLVIRLKLQRSYLANALGWPRITARSRS